MSLLNFFTIGDVVDRAVLAAKNAFPAWSSLSIPSRAEYLMKAATEIERRLEEFAVAEAKDQGKPLSLALKIDIPRVLTNLRAFAEGQKHLLETSNSMVSVEDQQFFTNQWIEHTIYSLKLQCFSWYRILDFFTFHET